jgi:hypothetical protein
VAALFISGTGKPRFHKIVAIELPEFYPGSANSLASEFEELWMKFAIKGTDDKARAALKTNFDAQNKAFEAGLNALFKAAPPAKPAAAPAADPAPVAKPSTGGRGTPLGTNRERRYI